MSKLPTAILAGCLFTAICIRLPAGEPVSIDRHSAVLAESIDEHFRNIFERNKIIAAPVADDAEFLRRISLDLIGRIPKVSEVLAFLAAEAVDKRSATIQKLLNSQEHAEHFASTWQALLIPEVETNAQLQYFVPGFEGWLSDRRKARVSFDAIVRELLTLTISNSQENPQMVLRDLRAPNPLAFYAAKEADPAKLAASTTRLFLGISLECAQCHNHPLGSWSQIQFWNQAAFFAGIERRGQGPFAPLWESPDTATIAVMATETRVAPRFLTATEDTLADDFSPRVALAEWITAKENPYFSKAIVNRVWANLFGRGLIEPVDDMHLASGDIHDALVSQLAEAFQSADFDMDYLISAICQSQTYQRTSRQTDSSQATPENFANKPLRSMTGEQFFRSLALAVDYPLNSDPVMIGRQQDPNRQKFVDLFGLTGVARVPETTVAQALTLMNGRFVQTAVDPEKGARLSRLLHNHDLDVSEKFEELVLATMSRRPTAEETSTIQSQVNQLPPEDEPSFWSDVLWALLNSPEFRWNH